MSLLPDCGWSALRALTVVLLAAPVCLWLVRFLRASEARLFQKAGLLTWGLLLVPFLTPDLLVGYAYGNFSPFPLVRYPWMCESLYTVLLWMKLVPVGVVILYFSPPSPISAEAMHCRRLLYSGRRSLGAPLGRPQPPFRVQLGDWLRGPARQLLPALGLIFLLAFQEFELGALLGITAGRVGSPVMWTRTLFESQAGIIDRLAPLKWSLWPVLFNLAVLSLIVPVVVRNAQRPASDSSQTKLVQGVRCVAVWTYLSVTVFLVTVLPLLFVLRESIDAFTAIAGSWQQFLGLLQEILVGCAFAAVAGLLAYLLAAVPVQRHRRPNKSETRVFEKTGFLGSFLALLPGLAGSLVVALSILYLFQIDWLNSLYDSPLPLTLALVLFLAPRALLLQLLFRAAQPGEPLRLAKLLSHSTDHLRRRTSGRLVWSLRYSRHFWATALLALWAYWDLTSTTLLHPSQMVPASVRLYNLMHYGHNAVLSAMTILAVGFPLLFALLLASLVRPLSRRLV